MLCNRLSETIELKLLLRRKSFVSKDVAIASVIGVLRGNILLIYTLVLLTFLQVDKSLVLHVSSTRIETRLRSL